MKLPIAAALISLLAITGCDETGDPIDDSQSFRAEGGTGTVKISIAVERPVKIRGCDPIWWLVGEEELISYEDAHEEWREQIRVGAEHSAGVSLEAFAAGGMCSAACREAGGDWTQELELEDSWHEVGETDVVGECPFGTLATETEVLAMGSVGCECAV